MLLLCSCSRSPAWSALAIALARTAALALALACDAAPIWLHFSRLNRLLGQSIFKGWARLGEGRTSHSGEGGSPERYPTIYLRVQDGGGGRRRWRGVGGAVAWGSPEKKLGTGGPERWQQAPAAEEEEDSDDVPVDWDDVANRSSSDDDGGNGPAVIDLVDSDAD